MKYKVGDKVRIKSLDWYNNKNNKGVIVCGSESFTHPMSYFCNKVVNIITIQDDCYRILEDDGDWYWTDEMIEGLVEDLLDNEMQEHQRICDEIMAIQGIEPIEAEDEHIVHCPQGYQFVDENGNVINATKIVLEKKKKEYPKTYEECCGVLGLNIWSELKNTVFDTMYKRDLMSAFHRLLICRDAYWKIAGEEMGLGKSWKPDLLNDTQDKFVLANWDYNIENHEYRTTNRNYILTFPTEEMRDAFYENFKKLIEQCKELL